MKKLLLFFSLIIFNNSFAQTDSNATLNELINSYIENSLQNVESSQIYSLFDYLQENPINLNEATISTLTIIPFIDYSTAEKILNYRESIKQFNSLSQLDSIKGIDKNKLQFAKYFLTLEKNKKSISRFKNKFWNNVNLYLRSRSILDLQKKKGFLTGKYLGTTEKYYSRFKLHYLKHYKIGVLFDKDAGEKSFNDFSSAHISINNFGLLDKLIAGDYLVEFGQGLAIWSPYGFSKSSEAVNLVIKHPRNLVEYTSVDENQYLRGLAGSVIINNFKLTGFYSNHKIDANVDSVSGFVLSLPLDGYHRTEGEIFKHNSVNELIYGGIVNYTPLRNLSLSLLLYNTKLNKSLTIASNKYLTGNNFSFYSFTYNALVKNILFNGEFAYNKLSVASINNIQVIFNRKFSFILSFRNYPRNFFNLKSLGFSEKSKTQNEIGFYAGIRWKTKIGLFNTYFDQYKFPEGTKDISFPSSGFDFLIDYYSTSFGTANFHLKFKNEKNEELDNSVNKIVPKISNSIRSELFINISKNLITRTRVEYKVVEISDNIQKGFLLFQDLKFVLLKHLFITGRFIIFDTDSYSTRIYEFENDLRGILFNPALFGKGIKWYLLFRYNILNFLDLSIKYSEMYKPDEISLGSGNNEIPNNLDNRVNLQLDIHF